MATRYFLRGRRNSKRVMAPRLITRPEVPAPIVVPPPTPAPITRQITIIMIIFSYIGHLIFSSHISIFLSQRCSIQQHWRLAYLQYILGSNGANYFFPNEIYQGWGCILLHKITDDKLQFYLAKKEIDAWISGDILLWSKISWVYLETIYWKLLRKCNQVLVYQFI
jgi:hypothetical protein